MDTPTRPNWSTNLPPEPIDDDQELSPTESLAYAYLESALMGQPDAIAFSEEIRELLFPACRRAAQTDLRLRSTTLPNDQRKEIVMAQLWEEVLPLLPNDDPDLLNEEHPTGWDPSMEEDDELEYARTHTEAIASCATTSS